MLLHELVETAGSVASTRSRSAKISSLASLLARLEPDEIPAAVGFLAGDPRQGRVGVGWARLSSIHVAPAADPELTVADLDRALDAIGAATGPGSTERRNDVLSGLLARATSAESDFIRRLLLGDLRQGALEGIMADAIARAAEAQPELVRRAWMLSGDLRRTALVALTQREAGLREIGLEVLRPVEPMLASTAKDVAEALAGSGPASVEWKLDGLRIQVHRRGDDVRVFTRNLNDITGRVPEIVALAASFPADPFVLDGEAIALGDDERPLMFQDIMSRAGRSTLQHELQMMPFYFDVLHAGGEDHIDRPLDERAKILDHIAGRWRIPSIRTSEASEAEAFLAGALEAGHEGVMIKALSSRYQAGRRGQTWRKVKPAHTLDLVVIAAEWGYGRRTGWLSNLHLGARDPAAGFVMVGKTFKGLTDETLRWQTEQFLEREVSRSGIVVHVRPELVVEIALDGVQSSTRYPGGVALRFARVKRYRPDKDAAGADTIDAVRTLLPRRR